MKPYITRACNIPADFLLPLTTFLCKMTSSNTLIILLGSSSTLKSDLPFKTILSLNSK